MTEDTSDDAAIVTPEQFVAIEGLSVLSNLCFERAAAAGWWTNPDTGRRLIRNKGEMIALMHSELSECLEGVRKQCRDDKLPHRSMEEVELADTLIRIFDYAGAFGLDLTGAVFEKLEYNRNRADHKLENRAKEGGKAF